MPIGFVNLADSNMQTFLARNARRAVFYVVPGGAATLTGLLALADSEDTDGPKFEWFEQRFTEKTATTQPVSAGVSGPWTDGVGTGGATIALTLTTPGTTNKATVKVSSTESMENWNVDERITFHRQKNGAGAFVDVHARITAVDRTNNILTVLVDAAITIDNDSAVYDVLITSEGVANMEGSRDSHVAAQLWPVNPYNLTQIWRTGMSWSGTAANQPMFFDIKGKGRSDRRDASVRHFIEIENSLIFGQRTSRNVTAADNTPSITRTTGGIIWHIEQYEAAGGGDAGYRPGGAALTANSDDEKRIVQGNGSGTVTYDEMTAYEERMFRRCMSSSNEKVGIGGSAAIAAILKWYEDKADIQITRPYKDPSELTFEFTTVTTRYGTLHLKSHPRFNDRGQLRNNLLICDMANLFFRPCVGRDTHLRENIHDNGFDGRKDEYLTEAGLELRFPESFMYMKNFQTIQTS